MSRIITTEEQLRKHIPNMIASVKGETTFIDRLNIFLQSAEQWVISTFTGEETFTIVCDSEESAKLKETCGRLVVAYAMSRAIPSLDIVLTPNGFGIVNTSNLAPASKHRVESLIEEMSLIIDDSIDALLSLLPLIPEWKESEQGAFFRATLFQELSIVRYLGHASGSRWERYLELRSQIMEIESSLAEGWFSPELMELLRQHIINSELTLREKFVVAGIRQQIIEFLRSGNFRKKRLADIVSYIQKNPDDFPVWHESDTAQLFSPPVFLNSMNSSGYFF